MHQLRPPLRKASQRPFIAAIAALISFVIIVLTTRPVTFAQATVAARQDAVTYTGAYDLWQDDGGNCGFSASPYTAGAISHAKRLVDAGADSLVVFPPLPTFSSKPLPAGIVVYFLVSNLFRVGQQALITRTMYRDQDGPLATTGRVSDKSSKSDGPVEKPKGFLAQLKEAGLIRGSVDGPRVCYCVEPAAVELLRALVADLR